MRRIAAAAVVALGLARPAAADDVELTAEQAPAAAQPPAPPVQGPPAPPPTVAQPARPAAQPTTPAVARPPGFRILASPTGLATAQATTVFRTALPTVFGDLLGGGFVPVALPVLVNTRGQIVGRIPVLLNPDGTRVTLANLAPAGPVDELLNVRPVRPGTPAAPTDTLTTRLVFPGPGQRFAPDPDQVRALLRLPLVARGTFKIAENETPRPTTRAYLTYNFYDNVFKGVGENTPRILLHQQTFGYEQAFADQSWSVGLRLPYNQLTSAVPGISDTGVGDLMVITKAAVYDDRATGDLLSAGLAITTPTGSVPLNRLTNERVHGTLLQPYLGYILNSRGGDAYVQGFTSLVVSTDGREPVLLTNALSAGYFAYKTPDERALIQAVIPVVEAHTTTPLSRRGVGGFTPEAPDVVTLLGGVQAAFRGGATVGCVVGAPITGPRPFSLQVGIQVNWRF